MPINDIVAEAADSGGAELIESGNAPEEDNAPDGDPEPTHMNTGPMLPPYLHTQTLSNRSAVVLVGTVLSLIGYARRMGV